MTLKENIESFVEPVYTPSKRSNDTYEATTRFVYAELDRLKKMYYESKNDIQTRRLIRDSIDHHLRRYHGYCIKEKIGAHYREKDLAGKKTVFEHMIPNSTIRDMFIRGAINSEQACNMPTCLLSDELDKKLKEKGWNSKTPDIFNFWKRYEYCFEIENAFETYIGNKVNKDMTLEDHFNLFQKKS
tara:strand:+ start:188 stop:745 length:558 start_codon:yes stop_codon:yes gene_type:complete